MTFFFKSLIIPLDMPNLKAAIKDLRKTKKRTERNQLIREELHSLRRFFRKAIEAKDVSKAKELANTLTKKFDKAAQKNIIKKNTSARYKSRMMQKVNAISK